MKREKVRSEEYQRKSEQAQQERFKDWGSYFKDSSLGASEPMSAESSKLYKAFYRTLAKEFHPDKGKDPTGEAMKEVNALKEQWGVFLCSEVTVMYSGSCINQTSKKARQ